MTPRVDPVARVVRNAKEVVRLRGVYGRDYVEFAEVVLAANERVTHGHNDTCDKVRDIDIKLPCTCGHDALRAALRGDEGSEG